MVVLHPGQINYMLKFVYKIWAGSGHNLGPEEIHKLHIGVPGVWKMNFIVLHA